MAYRRSSSRGGYRRGSSTRSRSYTTKRTRSAPRRARAPASNVMRIVIENPAAGQYSRYPGVAAKLEPVTRKAKY